MRPWASPFAYRAGIVMLLAPLALAAYVWRDDWSDDRARSRWLEASSMATEPATATGQVAATASTVSTTNAMPVPPRFESTVATTTVTPSRRIGPDAPIYRCKVGRRTLYTQEPCEDGRRVDTVSPVEGFETRSAPSEPRVASLAVDADTVARERVMNSRTASSRSAPSDCAAMARQIVDIDAEARRPRSSRELDELRQTRQDIRTRMAREHC